MEFECRNSLDILFDAWDGGIIPEIEKMNPRSFTLALVQMEVCPGDPAGNLARAAERITEAAAGGADLALLPECLDFGWTDPSCREGAGTIPGGESFTALGRAAGKEGIWVCGGITEREGDRIYNAAVLLDRRGRLVSRYRKINELDIARSLYTCGDGVEVVETELGRLGLMICADGFAEDLAISRSLGEKGAGVILSPCAWAVPADHDNEAEPYGDLWRDSYGPVAREFGCAIAGVSNVGPILDGPWQGRNCIGCSLVIGPEGEEVLQGPYGVDADCVLYVTVESGSVRVGKE